MTDNTSPSSISRVARTLMVVRWICLVVLPPTAAGLTFLAAVSTGQTRTNLWLGVIFAALLLAALQIYGEVQEWKANRASVNAKVALAGALDQQARPLITVLERVAEASDDGDRRTQVNTLITMAVGIASSQCGRLTPVDCQPRSVFYEFFSANKLVRVCQNGRTGPVARPDFARTRNDHDRAVVQRAEGENAILFPDLTDPRLDPSHVEDDVKRAYKCFLMVPVRTSKRSYGFLAVDSDKANTLTNTDVGYAVLLAGLMASAIALLGEEYPRLAGGADD